MQNNTGKKKKIIILIIALIIVLALFITGFYFATLQKHYSQGETLLSKGEYQTAATVFSSLDDYRDSEEKLKDCYYGLAKGAEKSGDYKTAFNYLKKAGSIVPPEEMEIITVLVSDVGDLVTFGAYEQDGDISNGKERIEWKVLDTKDDEILLLSTNNLDCIKYNETWSNTSWADCSLREWLNTTFLTNAFSKDEIKSITQSKLKNSGTGKRSNDSTEDKVFVLSADEWEEFHLKAGTNTQYAIDNGVYNEDGVGWSWLRTEGIDQDHVQEIDCQGKINKFGSFVDCDNEGVRPAIRINGGTLDE